jgi:hypothetical protein
MDDTELDALFESVKTHERKLFNHRAEKLKAEYEDGIKRHNQKLIEKAISEVANKIVENGDCFTSVYDTGLTMIAKNGDRYKVGIVVMREEETEAGSINKSEQ